jgi:hypothetical protein
MAGANPVLFFENALPARQISHDTGNLMLPEADANFIERINRLRN